MVPSDKTLEKHQIRLIVRQRLSKMRPEEKAQRARSIVRRTQQFLMNRCIVAIGLYYPLADEPDIVPLIVWCLQRGMTVALPRIPPEKPFLEMKKITNLDADIEPGFLGIRQPSPWCPTVPLKALDTVIVPGRAFDPKGVRLGRGLGFYDRFLPLLRPDCLRIAVAYEVQIFSEIPAEDQDALVDIIITEERLIETERERANETGD